MTKGSQLARTLNATITNYHGVAHAPDTRRGDSLTGRNRSPEGASPAVGVSMTTPPTRGRSVRGTRRLRKTVRSDTADRVCDTAGQPADATAEPADCLP